MSIGGWPGHRQGMSNDLSITFSVDASPERVIAATQDVRAWWGAGIDGASDRVGDTFHYRHDDLHDSTQEVVELVPGVRLVWRVTAAHLSFVAHPREWEGTHIRFEAAPRDGRTELRFTHVGLTPAAECFDMCSKGWGYYVGESLHALLATGRGSPDPVDKMR